MGTREAASKDFSRRRRDHDLSAACELFFVEPLVTDLGAEERPSSSLFPKTAQRVESLVNKLKTVYFCRVRSP